MSMKVDSQNLTFNAGTPLKVNQSEIERQSGLTSRLGNKDYSTHEKLNCVQDAVRMLTPQNLQQILGKAQNAMAGNGKQTQVEHASMPQLTQPESATTSAKEGTRLSMEALTCLMARLVTDGSINGMVTRLQNYLAMMAGNEKMYGDLANQLEVEGEEWATASDALKAAQQQADALSKNVDQAQSALDEAQKQLDDLQAEANNTDPVPESLQKKIDNAKTAVASAQATLSQAITTNTQFVNNTLNPAIKAESQALGALNSTMAKSNDVIKTVSPQQQNAIEINRKKADEQAKSLTFLIALMSKLIEESSSKDLEATAELKQKLAEASAKDAEKKAKEYDDQVRKSEEMQKTMGCIAKIFGWLITVFSFVAAAFTGGASLALAAIGLGLAIGDEICQAVAGFSFMAKALEPLMNAIIKPLMELLGKVFASILEAMGVDKATAQLVGQIMGAIAAAIIIVAAVMVAGSVVSKVSGAIAKRLGIGVSEEATKSLATTMAKEVGQEVGETVAKDVLQTAVKEVAEEIAEEVAEEMIEQTSKSMLQRLMDNTVGQLMKRISQGFGRAMGMSDINITQTYNRAQMGLLGAEAVNVSINMAGGVVVGNMMVEASKIRAQLMKDAAVQELLGDMMDRAIDTFSQRIESVNQIVKNISTVAENQLQTGKYITQRLSSVAV